MYHDIMHWCLSYTVYIMNTKMLTCSPNLTSGDGVTSEVGEERAAREAVGVLYADEGGMPSSPAPPPPLAEASLLVGVSPPPSPPDAAPAPRLPRLECHQAGNVTSKVKIYCCVLQPNQ